MLKMPFKLDLFIKHIPLSIILLVLFQISLFANTPRAKVIKVVKMPSVYSHRSYSPDRNKSGFITPEEKVIAKQKNMENAKPRAAGDFFYVQFRCATKDPILVNMKIKTSLSDDIQVLNPLEKEKLYKKGEAVTYSTAKTVKNYEALKKYCFDDKTKKGKRVVKFNWTKDNILKYGNIAEFTVVLASEDGIQLDVYSGGKPKQKHKTHATEGKYEEFFGNRNKNE
ncbi:MAG: hypothetical protein P9M03_08520 [Candidatus Theseobacter exili]|nr:hypothetical protein [Candidatus Theseobacter exili]